MNRRKNIKNFAAKAVCLGLLLLTGLFSAAPAFAETDQNTQQKIDEYYKSHQTLEVSQKSIDTIDKVEAKWGRKKFADYKRRKLKEHMTRLAKYTGKEGWGEGTDDVALIRFGHSGAENALKNAEIHLSWLKKSTKMTDDEYNALLTEIHYLANTVNQRLNEVAALDPKTAKEKEVDTKLAEMEEEIADVQEEILGTGGIVSCPTSDQLKARYHAGCWSCLVLEKLTSAFLHAANHGLKVVQKAGLTLLWLGTAIWIVFWGLKNVSSFTEIQLGNILNDLFKFLFKAAIAYWFIVYSTTAISKYFITPMMSVGARIGQEFWSQDVKDFTREWDDAEPVEDLQTVVDEAKKEGAAEIAQNQTTTEITTPEQQEMLNAAKQMEIHESANSDIPAFITPGVPGHISSYPGCRKPFRTSNGKMGSTSHMGLDVGGNDMAPITAIAGGTITYSGNASTGWGLKAMITTTHKGNTWIHLYGHMNPKTYAKFKNNKNGRTVVRGEQIGNVGTTGNSTGPHLHLEVQLTGKVGGYNYKQAYLDPISLGQGKIVPRAYKYDEATKTFTFYKARCNGTFVDPIPPTGYAKGAKLPAGGFSSNGKAGLDLSDTYVMDGTGADGAGDTNYDSLIVEIPEVKYTGPTNIMPKSIMNSILGATRAITNTTADVMVMGNMMMCYSRQKDGGAWKINADWLPEKLQYWTNWVMWIQGGIIWCLGFMLTVAIAYYLVDISFKIGFAVLAIPVVMGLWPFGFTQGKLFVALSIIAKSSATFAFLALTTAFGMGLVSAAVGGLDEIYEVMDAVAQGEEVEELKRSHVRDALYLFSPTFVLLIFAILYFFKLVQQTISDLVNKFFPDQAFGDSSPMHSGATMATSFLKKMAGKATDLSLARDIVTHRAGNLVKGGIKRTGKAIRHPIKSAKAVGRGIKKAAKAITGRK